MEKISLVIHMLNANLINDVHKLIVINIGPIRHTIPHDGIIKEGNNNFCGCGLFSTYNSNICNACDLHRFVHTLKYSKSGVYD